MCEDKEKCDWYTRKGWKDANIGEKEGFDSLDDYFTAFMQYHLFGGSSLECGCCGAYVDPDGNCGICGWENVMLRMGVM